MAFFILRAFLFLFLLSSGLRTIELNKYNNLLQARLTSLDDLWYRKMISTDLKPRL